MVLAAGTPHRVFGGMLDVRVEIDTGLVDDLGDLWDTGLWDDGVWGAEDPSWYDMTRWVTSITIGGGAERYGQRYSAATATITVDNTTGIFTPDVGVDVPWLQPFRPGRRIRIVVYPDPTTPTKVPLFTGQVQASNDRFSAAGFDVSASIVCVDHMAIFAAFNPPALATATGVGSTDEIVGKALDRMSWPNAMRDIQPGVHTMQSTYLAQTTLEECARCADAEGGAFFAAPDGKATFKARDWLTTDPRSTTPQGWLGFDPPPPGANTAQVLDWQTAWEIARIQNQIMFARTGSTLQTVQDLPSQAAIGQIRTYQRTDLQNNRDDQVLYLANRYLAAYKDLRLLVTSVTIAPNHDPDNEDLNRLIWDTRYGDLLAIRIAPPHGWEYTRYTHVIGITHRITVDDWEVEFALDDALASFEES